MIPDHCTPPPWTLKFGREISEMNRRHSFGSSICLKRGADQLGSPNSPPINQEQKKNRNKGDQTPNTKHDQNGAESQI